jgi:hypothetical protein
MAIKKKKVPLLDSPAPFFFLSPSGENSPQKQTLNPKPFVFSLEEKKRKRQSAWERRGKKNIEKKTERKEKRKKRKTVKKKGEVCLGT